MLKDTRPEEWTCKFLRPKDVIDVLKRVGGVDADGKPSDSWHVMPAELETLLGGLTPSERAQKAKLMRQFQRMPEGQSGNSRAYVESPVWCHCGRLNGTHSHRRAA